MFSPLLKVYWPADYLSVGSWISAAVVLIAATLSSGMVRAQALDTAATPPARAENPVHRTARWRIVPRFAVTETYSNNVMRAPSSSAVSGWTRDLNPGISIEGAGPRVSGFLNFSLRDLAYASRSQLNNRQNLLNSFATVEAVENWLFVDARAGIMQQNISAFGAPTNDFAGAGSNRTETTTYQISPYVRGKFSHIADYQIRFNRTGSRTSSGAIPATEISQWVSRFRNAPSSSRLGWSMDSDAMTIQNKTVGNKQNGRFRGSLIFDITPDLHGTLSYGRENTNYSTSAVQSSNTPGFGLEWSPGPRTQIVAIKERRSFGEGRKMFFSHRTPLVSLKYTDDKDVTVNSSQATSGGEGSISAMMSDLLASSIPDPVARGQAVRSRLDQAGVPTTASSGSFATSRIYTNHNREVSAVLLGRVNTITLTLKKLESDGIGFGAASIADSFTSSNQINQQIGSIAWTHKLSALSTLTYNTTRQRSIGSATAATESTLSAHNVSLTSQIGAKLNGSIGVRRTQFMSTISPGFRENAIVGTLSMSF